MNLFSKPAREHMTGLSGVLRADDDLNTAETRLAQTSSSALPVLDERGALVGVLSRTDLLRVARVQLVTGQWRRLMTLPKLEVAQLMSATVEASLATSTHVADNNR